jgi:hypothetical protein
MVMMYSVNLNLDILMNYHNYTYLSYAFQKARTQISDTSSHEYHHDGCVPEARHYMPWHSLAHPALTPSPTCTAAKCVISTIILNLEPGKKIKGMSNKIIKRHLSKTIS